MLPNNKNLITIYTFTYPHEAYIIKGKLESEGIYCSLKDELTIQIDNFYSNALNGVKLQVEERNVEEAIAIMKEGGFKFEEVQNPPKMFLKLEALSNKIPLINKLPVLWRLLLFLTLIVILIAGMAFLFNVYIMGSV